MPVEAWAGAPSGMAAGKSRGNEKPDQTEVSRGLGALIAALSATGAHAAAPPSLRATVCVDTASPPHLLMTQTWRNAGPADFAGMFQSSTPSSTGRTRSTLSTGNTSRTPVRWFPAPRPTRSTRSSAPKDPCHGTPTRASRRRGWSTGAPLSATRSRSQRTAGAPASNGGGGIRIHEGR